MFTVSFFIKDGIDGRSDEPSSDEQFEEIEALSLDGMYTDIDYYM